MITCWHEKHTTTYTRHIQAVRSPIPSVIVAQTGRIAAPRHRRRDAADDQEVTATTPPHETRFFLSLRSDPPWIFFRTPRSRGIAALIKMLLLQSSCYLAAVSSLLLLLLLKASGSGVGSLSRSLSRCWRICEWAAFRTLLPPNKYWNSG
jgi:hypothetical protein